MRALKFILFLAVWLTAMAAVVWAYPPATLTDIGPNSVKVGGLDCGGIRYELRLREYRSGAWRDSTTQTFRTAGCPPPVDTTPPDTTITAGPAEGSSTTSTDASFSFSATEPGTFECKLDAGAYESCSSPKAYSGLELGAHSFQVRAKDQAGNVDSTPATRNWTVAEPPPVGTPELTPIDGGSNYYGQFSNPLSDDPSFFPIGVWGSYDHTQQNRDLDAAAGINTYVWLADPCGGAPAIRADGRFKVIYSESENRTCKGSESVGWLAHDELDMTCGPPGCDGYTIMESTLGSLPADGQVRYNNYGKGVLLWESDADAARWINGRSGSNSFQQIVSTDLYWFTDPNESGSPRYGYASSYGDDVAKVRRLDALDGQRQAVWNFVETGWPFTESAAQGGRAITGLELRAAAWHSLIAGARGINWFQHSLGGPNTGDHHTIRSNSEGTRPAVTAVNGQIKDLAPALNAPSVTSGHSASDTMAGDVRYRVKWSGGKFYVLAGADRGGGDATFQIPCVGDATATRLAPSNLPGEAASLPVNGGQWTDSFADKNTVHIYRIDGGSSCGL